MNVIQTVASASTKRPSPVTHTPAKNTPPKLTPSSRSASAYRIPSRSLSATESGNDRAAQAGVVVRKTLPGRSESVRSIHKTPPPPYTESVDYRKDKKLIGKIEVEFKAFYAWTMNGREDDSTQNNIKKLLFSEFQH